MKEGVGLEQLLNKLNDTMERMIIKIDDQSKKLTEIEVKVDFYRETQNEHARKLEAVDKIATEAMSSTKSAHKRLDVYDTEINKVSEINDHGRRLDKLEKIVFWVSTTIIGAVILGLMGLFITKK